MKTYVPDSHMRINPLSIQPGGSTVVVKFPNHEVVYTNIKNPRAYINKIKKTDKDVVAFYVNGELWQN